MKLNAEIQQKKTNTVQRISCTMSEKEFVDKYVRTMTPVLIQGCDYGWLKNINLTLPGAAKVSKLYYINLFNLTNVYETLLS